MAATSEITISLNRAFNSTDQKAVTHLMAQWLVYDVKIQRKFSSTEIHLFHTIGAKSALVKEINELFPNENLLEIGM